MVATREEKPVLIEVEKEFRVIIFDDKNLVLETWEPEQMVKGKMFPPSYRFNGYYGNLKSVFRKLLSVYINRSEKPIRGLDEAIKHIEESERKILDLFEKSKAGEAEWIGRKKGD